MYACILFVYAFMHLTYVSVHDAEQQCYIGWTLLHQAAYLGEVSFIFPAISHLPPFHTFRHFMHHFPVYVHAYECVCRFVCMHACVCMNV